MSREREEKVMSVTVNSYPTMDTEVRKLPYCFLYIEATQRQFLFEVNVFLQNLN